MVATQLGVTTVVTFSVGEPSEGYEGFEYTRGTAGRDQNEAFEFWGYGREALVYMAHQSKTGTVPWQYAQYCMWGEA